MSSRVVRPCRAIAFTLLPLLTGLAQASVPALPAPVAAAPTAAEAALTLPANTVVELELSANVGSRASRPGDTFALRVSLDVVVGGRVVIPAGTPAVGQVVHAQKAGAGGKPGELILAARYLELPQGRLKLRSSFGAVGVRHAGASFMAAQFVGPFGMAVKGGEIDIPAGTRLATRTAEAIELTGAAPAAPAGSALPPVSDPSVPSTPSTTSKDS